MCFFLKSCSFLVWRKDWCLKMKTYFSKEFVISYVQLWPDLIWEHKFKCHAYNFQNKLASQCFEHLHQIQFVLLCSSMQEFYSFFNLRISNIPRSSWLNIVRVLALKHHNRWRHILTSDRLSHRINLQVFKSFTFHLI